MITSFIMWDPICLTISHLPWGLMSFPWVARFHVVNRVERKGQTQLLHKKVKNTRDFSQGSFSSHCHTVSLLKTSATLVKLITSQDCVDLCTECLILLDHLSLEDSSFGIPGLQHLALVIKPYTVTLRWLSSLLGCWAQQGIHLEHLFPLPAVGFPTKGFQVPRGASKHTVCFAQASQLILSPRLRLLGLASCY